MEMNIQTATSQHKGTSISALGPCRIIELYDVKADKNGNPYRGGRVKDASGEVPVQFWGEISRDPALVKTHIITLHDVEIDEFQDKKKISVKNGAVKPWTKPAAPQEASKPDPEPEPAPAVESPPADDMEAQDDDLTLLAEDAVLIAILTRRACNQTDELTEEEKTHLVRNAPLYLTGKG